MQVNTLLIPGDFPPITSGIATYFYEIWKFLSSDENLILAAKYEGCRKFDRETSLKIIRHYVPKGNSMIFRAIKSILYFFWTMRLYSKYNFKQIHCGQVLSSGITGFLMNNLFGTSYIVYVYGSETYRFGSSRLLSYLMSLSLSNAEKIVPNSEFTKNEFIEFGIPEYKFEKITPGVDIEKFSPSMANHHLLNKYDLHDKKILLTVGRLDVRKGHDRVIEAIGELKKEYPELRYLIVGKGEEKERLKHLVKKHGVQENVIFCGYVSDNQLPHYYNLCDVFILMNRQTSSDPRLKGDYEGFGIVFLEAAATGKPAIAGDFGGIRDAVKEEESGYIIEDNITTVKDKIKYLLDNPDIANKLGRNARERVERSFTWKDKSKQIKEIL